MIGIIPAAGKGTRFKELGKTYSKCILPFQNKPIIVHNIDWLKSQGCNEIRIIVNHLKDDIIRIINMYHKDIMFIEQTEMSGLSSAVYESIKDVGDTDILIVLGDLVVNGNINTINSFISVKEVSDYERWCMVSYENNKVIFFDKPKIKPATNLAVSGVYYLKSSDTYKNAFLYQIENNIKINNEYQISTVLNQFNDLQLDKSISIIDFGTIEEYFENMHLRGCREFNSIQYKNQSVIKSSSDLEKIYKEYVWFKSMPIEMEYYIPKLYDHNINWIEKKSSYEIEKINYPTLKDIYLFIDSSYLTWVNIFNKLFEIINIEKNHTTNKTDFLSFVYDKTVNRYESYKKDVSYDDNLIVENFLNQFKNIIHNTKFNNTIMHGDLCFSNILYSLQNDNIKLIDPRGDLFGSYLYDIAKIMHSVIYDYDFIDSGLYIYENNNLFIYNKGTENAKQAFMDIFELFTKEEQMTIRYICASLFLSMIPLHYHNKTNQTAYFTIFKKILKDIYL